MWLLGRGFAGVHCRWLAVRWRTTSALGRPRHHEGGICANIVALFVNGICATTWAGTGELWALRIVLLVIVAGNAEASGSSRRIRNEQVRAGCRTGTAVVW